jgi:replicative DNA helicase
MMLSHLKTDTKTFSIPEKDNPVEPFLIRYLSSENYVKRMITEVNPSWILNRSNKIIFEIVINYYKSSGKLPDKEIVVDEIKKNNHKIETTINIYNSIDNWKNEIHDTQYLKSKKSVEDYYNREYMTLAMSHALESLKNQETNNAIEFLEEKLDDLRIKFSNNTVIDYDIAEFAPTALERYSTSFTEEEVIPSGITNLDEKMGGGFRKPNLVALGSGTQGGKSIVCMNFAYFSYQSNLNVAYITLEMSEEELLSRLHSRISSIPATEILMRELDDVKTTKLRKSILLDATTPETKSFGLKLIKEFDGKLKEFSKEELEKQYFQNPNIERRRNTFYPIDIPSGCTIEEVKSRVSKLKEQRGCDVLVIDYPGIMSEIINGEQSWHSYSNLFAELKALARALDVVVLAPVQSQEDGSYKYSTAIRDHIDIGINWKRTTEDIVKKRLRFWFTKLRHSKIEIAEELKELIADFTNTVDKDGSDIDYSMQNPIFASLDTDIMKLDNYFELKSKSQINSILNV